MNAYDDVFAGYSPTGSSASGVASYSSPTDYMTQAGMNPGTNFSKPGMSDEKRKAMLASMLSNLGGKGGYAQQSPLEMVNAQPTYQQVAQQAPIQDVSQASTNPYILFGDDEKKKLAQALRES
jgi:hypothetical protein